MKNILRRITTFVSNPYTFPLFLLVLCLAAYGPLLTRLGFYWDDFPMNWIASTMGGDGLARYFSTNRPVWGLIYRTTTPLLGSRPLTWQVFALLMRWVTGLSLWALLRLVWPERERQKGSGHFAAWAAALFVIYPGFTEQYISFLYSHFYIVLTSFLLSLTLMALAQRTGERSRRWFWLLTGLSLLLSLLNMLSMEYFFLLDLLRPLLLWVILSERIPDYRKRLGQTLLAWLPYLIVFAGAMYWRSVLFGFQTYQPALMSRIKAQPVQAILQLIPLVLSDVWKTSAVAWARVFTIPNGLQIGARNLQRYELFVAAGALVSVIYLAFFRPGAAGSQARPAGRSSRAKAWLVDHSWAWQPLVIGMVALFIAGGPFWLTDLKIGLVFPNDRFTVPFMLGVSLVFAGLLALLPLPQWSKAGLLGIALGFAIGFQFTAAIDYNRDWSVQRSMFWQMVWRMPDIQPGTVLLMNELPIRHYTDNSLTAPLNWTYDPHNNPGKMSYVLFYPTLRQESVLSNYQKNRPVELNYLATTFYGNTSQMISLFYNPPGCVRVLDPEIDLYNWNVPPYLRDSLSLSTTAPILPTPQPGKSAPRPPQQIYGAEIQRGWCYFFEKADLARQQGQWETVAALGDQAFAGKDYPNDPLERFPFIEGYAHTGHWDRAIEQTRASYAVSPLVYQPMLCKLWERIQRQTPADPAQKKALQSIQNDLACGLAADH